LLGIFITVLILLGSLKRLLGLLEPSLAGAALEVGDFMVLDHDNYSLQSAALSPARPHKERLVTVSMTL